MTAELFFFRMELRRVSRERFQFSEAFTLGNPRPESQALRLIEAKSQ
jgi:hypothetical protein